jgi:hypothetical protein
VEEKGGCMSEIQTGEETQTVEVDKLASFREAAAAEQADKAERSKMSEAAKAKLRALGEHDRLDAASDVRIVNAFTSREWTVEQLVDLFAKSFGAGESPRRRAIKAAYRLDRGFRVYHFHDVSFAGELLPGENEMPMSKFLARYPLPENQTVTPVAGSTEGRQKEPKVRPCKSAAKCIWAKRRKAAPAVGRSQYCTPACQKCDTARRRRSSSPTVTPDAVAA